MRMVVLLLVALAVPLSSCGEAPAVQARAYQSAVRAISDRESAQLARYAEQADFSTQARASQTTRSYGAAFAEAAKQLGELQPPNEAQAEHAALVAVYRDVAAKCASMASAMAAAPDAATVDGLTRQLAATVTEAGTRERAARAEIERSLAPLLAAASQGAARATIVGSNEA